MEITTIGYMLLPFLAIFLFIEDPRPLLGLVIVSAALQGAGAINIHDSALPISLIPYNFCASIAVIRLILDLIRRRWSPASLIRRFPKELTVLSLFTAWAILSTLLLPVIFRGIYVDNPRLGTDGIYYSHLVPLEWTHSNLAQILYIGLDLAAFLYFIVIYDQGLPILPVFRWFAGTAIGVILLGYYHFIANRTGIPFPYQLLFSNIVAFPDVYKFAAHIRVSSTFSEPSYLGSFCSLILGMNLSALVYSDRYTVAAITFALFSLILVAISGATTGFLGVFAAFGLFACICLVHGVRAKSLPTSAALAGIAIPLGSLAAIPVLGRRFFHRIVSESLLDKLSTGSAMHRLRADIIGYRILIETHGLGVGLGSDRPSSFLPSILASTGLIGTVLFLIFLYRTIRKPFRLHQEPNRRGSVDPRIVATGLLIQFIAMVAAIPDVTWPFLWIFLGLTTVLTAERETSVRRRLVDSWSEGYC